MGPSEVFMACGLANAVIPGVDFATGNTEGAARAATIGQYLAGQNLISFVRLGLLHDR